MTSSAAPASSSATQTSVASSTRPTPSTRPAQVDHAGDTGDADGHVGEAAAPGAPEGVRHHDADGDTVPVLEPLADAPGGTVGIDREQRRGARVDVGEVDPRVGADEAVARLGDHQVAAAPEHPHRLALDQCPLGLRPRPRRPATTRPSAFETTFWVTTRTSPSAMPPGTHGWSRTPVDQHACQQLGEVVAGRDLPEAGDREAGERAGDRSGGPAHPAASSTARASAADRSRVDITVGRDHAADPFGLDRVGQCRVRLVDHQRAHPAARTSGPPRPPTTRTPSRRGADRRVPSSAAPATIGETPTIRSRRSSNRSATPGTASSGPDRDDRVRRADHDRLGLVDRLEHAGARASVRRPGERDAGDLHVVAAVDEVLLEGDLLAVGQRSGGCERGSSVTGRTRIPTPKARASSAVTVPRVAPSDRRWVR